MSNTWGHRALWLVTLGILVYLFATIPIAKVWDTRSSPPKRNTSCDQRYTLQLRRFARRGGEVLACGRPLIRVKFSIPLPNTEPAKGLPS